MNAVSIDMSLRWSKTLLATLRLHKITMSCTSAERYVAHCVRVNIWEISAQNVCLDGTPDGSGFPFRLDCCQYLLDTAIEVHFDFISGEGSPSD